MVNKLRVVINLTLLLVFAGSGCAPAAPESPPRVMNLYATQAAQPWLPNLYSCAEQHETIIRLTDPNQAQVLLRVGEPPYLSGVAYQLGQEELVLVLNSQNPVQFLSQEQVFQLFTGQVNNWQPINQLDAPVQVWSFANESDIGQVFNGTVLQLGRITSTARQASAAEEMRVEIAQDVNAIGFIGRHSAGTDIRTISLEQPVLAPVLAILEEEPDGFIKDVLACAQQKTTP